MNVGWGWLLAIAMVGCTRSPPPGPSIVKDPAAPVSPVVAPQPSRPTVIVTAKPAASPFGHAIMVETRNDGDVAISVEDELVVEVERDGRWERVAESYTTVGACDAALTALGKPKARACQSIGAHAVLVAALWQGMSCSSQCMFTCYRNARHPAGRYRFVVTRCGAPTVRVASEPIEWSNDG